MAVAGPPTPPGIIDANKCPAERRKQPPQPKVASPSSPLADRAVDRWLRIGGGKGVSTIRSNMQREPERSRWGDGLHASSSVVASGKDRLETLSGM